MILIAWLPTGCARMRPHRASGHLRARLPPHSRGIAIRATPAPEEDQGEQVTALATEEVIRML